MLLAAAQDIFISWGRNMQPDNVRLLRSGMGGKRMKSHMIYQSVDFLDFGAIVFDNEYESRIKQHIIDEYSYLPLDVLCAWLDADQIPYEKFPEQYDGGDLTEFLIRMMRWVAARCPEVQMHEAPDQRPVDF
jgi:hypothetical protein